jgi:serine/threonine protein kinase
MDIVNRPAGGPGRGQKPGRAPGKAPGKAPGQATGHAAGRSHGPAHPPPVPAPSQPLAPPPPVEQIAGYRILAPLGKGSMGAVYQAVQLSLDRVVAIKILTPALAMNDRLAKRFEREALASSKLNHPNVVAALDVGEENGLRYLVMEFVPGNNVAQLLDAGPIEEHRAVGIVIQVARALDHAHRIEIVHRDIKPANILVTGDGVAKLGDLGLAKIMEADASQTEEGMAMGTPFYVSPEQARGERRIDIRSDLYSLGATLYHMVTGRVPFPGPNPAVVMTRHLNDLLEPPDEVNPDLDPALAQVIEKMMAKDREARYQTPAELIADLQAWLEGRLVVKQKIEFKTRRRFRRF